MSSVHNNIPLWCEHTLETVACRDWARVLSVASPSFPLFNADFTVAAATSISECHDNSIPRFFLGQGSLKCPTSHSQEQALPISVLPNHNYTPIFDPGFTGVNHHPISPSNCQTHCQGIKKAVVIGINYFGQLGELEGCTQDARNFAQYLIDCFNYSPNDIVLLGDNLVSPGSQLIKANILRAMHWLVKNAKPGDSIFFYYSGG